jgi:hypothetical protein
MTRIPPHQIVALSFLVTLAGAGPAAAQQKITAKGSAAEDCAYDGRCGTVRLPDGLVLLGGCRLVAKRGRIEAVVASLDTSSGEWGSCPVLRAIVVHEDGTLTAETSWNESVSVSRAHIDARLALASARQFEKRKRLPEAEQALARALALEPGFEEASLALARVRLDLGKPAQAAAVLAPLLDKEPLRIYAHVLSDRKLHPLAGQEPFVAVRAKQAGTAEIADPQSPIIAFAAERELFALVQRRPVGIGSSDISETNLLVFDANGIRAVLPLLDASGEADQNPTPAATLRRRIGIANRFLADFGFAAIPEVERVTFTRKPTGTDAASFPKARFAIAFRDGFARLVRGKQVLHVRRIHEDCTGPRGDRAFSCEYPPSATWAAWLPARDTLIFEWVTSGAEWSPIDTIIEVWPLGGAPGGRVTMPQGKNPR